MRNDGSTNWPEDTFFISTNGDDMKAEPLALDVPVVPDQEHVWEVEFVAPQKLGRYTSYFRMVTGNNYRFGHKVWCDV